MVTEIQENRVPEAAAELAPPQRIRVAIVDDSEVYRIYLRKILLEHPDFDVICLASNGRLAIPRIRHYLPDVVILDYDMPEMNGLETIREIRAFSSDIRIMMFSAHTIKGARLTIEALTSGAEDFITKPGLTPGDLEAVQKSLPEKIRQLVSHTRKPKEDLPSLPKYSIRDTQTFQYCGIGISTGGPTALRKMLPLIPKNIQGSLLIVQHLPAMFTKQLAENLSQVTELKVLEAEDGMQPQSGCAYIAPGGMQMELAKSPSGAVLRVLAGPVDELCKPSVNILFESLAQNFAGQSAAVIMTGMGEDGLKGMRSMHRAGSYLMAQSAEDCLIFGMPAKPIGEGLIASQGTVEQLARKITSLLGGK